MEQKEKSTLLKIVGGCLGATVVIIGGYVLFHKPHNGIMHINSHINKSSGKPKIPYSRIQSNYNAVVQTIKEISLYSPYLCPFCGNFHIGHSKCKK